MSNEQGEPPYDDHGTDIADEQPTDWATNVGRPSLDDDVAALAAASRTPEALLKPDDVQVPLGESEEIDDALIVSDAQTLRVLMVERAAKVLTDLAERPGFGRRAAVDLEDVLELADYLIGVEHEYPLPGQSTSGVVVDEGKRFFDQMTQQADFRPKLSLADRMAAQAEQARIYREGTGSLFHTMMKPGAHHPRSATAWTGGKEPSFGELLDSLFGKPVQANIRVEELKVGDLTTSHGDVVVTAPTWDGTAERWLVTVHCPKKDETYVHRATVDEKVDIFNER